MPHLPPPAPVTDQALSPDARARLKARLNRVVDLVETDVLVREGDKAPSRPRTLVDVEVTHIASDADWPDAVPADRRAGAVSFLARGDVGFVAIVDGAFAGWIWLSRTTHRDPWSGLHVHLADDEAYAYALWIEPELRPKGVARLLMVAMLETVVADPALTRVYGWVDRGNRESQFLLRLLGFKDVQTVKRVMLLDRRGSVLPRSDRPRYGPMSARGRHRPAKETTA